MEEDRRCCLEKDSDVMVDWAAWHASANYPLIRARLLAWNAYLFFWPRSETLIKQANKNSKRQRDQIVSSQVLLMCADNGIGYRGENYVSWVTAKVRLYAGY
jgi:hypothetical protein